MNNKGFTMVELLVAMSIMGLLIIMAFPTIRAIQANNTNKRYDSYGDSLISAAQLYVDSYGDDLFDPDRVNQSKILETNQLQLKGIIKDIGITDTSCINNDSYLFVIKYKDDYTYCLNLTCKTSGGNVVYHKSDKGSETGACKKFDTRTVHYVYNGPTPQTVDVEVVKNDTSYKILPPERLVTASGKTLAQVMKADHVDFETWVIGSSQHPPNSTYGAAINSDVTFTASTVSWTYTIQYQKDTNGTYSGDMASRTCTCGAECILDDINFTRTGYTFNHWEKDASHTYTNKQNVKTAIGQNLITANHQTVTLKAKFNPNTVTVTYNCNGGTGSPANQTFTYDVANQKFNATCTKSNYVLIGWKNSSTGTSKDYDVNQAVSNDWINANKPSKTVYAHWTSSTVTLSYDANGGSGTTSSTTCNYNQNCTISNNNFSKTGYSFDGWNTKADGTGTNYAAGGTIKITSATKLYAKWKAHVLKIRYKINSGETLDTGTGAGFTNEGGYAKKNGTTYFHNVKYDQNLGTDGLANYNNSSYLKITKSHYTGVSGKEWKTGTQTFNQATNYKAQDLCSSLATGDCTIELSVNWRPNVAYIQFNTNSNSAVVKNTGHGFKKINNYQVVDANNNRKLQYITYGVSADDEQHDLWDYHNNSWLYIQKTASDNGTAHSGSEWHMANNGNCERTTYNQSQAYTADQYCNTTNGDCTCTVRVNWS